VTKLLLYLRIGRVVYGVLRRAFPDLGRVPLEDVLHVVEELLRTSATVRDVAVQVEPAPVQSLLATRPTPEAQYRLVIKGPVDE